VGPERGRRRARRPLGRPRGPARRHAGPAPLGVLPGARLRGPRQPGLGAAAAGPARLGARAGRLRHAGRVGAGGVRVHRPGQRPPARFLAPRDGREPLRDGLPGHGRWPVRVVPRPAVAPRDGRPRRRRHASGRPQPRPRGTARRRPHGRRLVHPRRPSRGGAARRPGHLPQGPAGGGRRLRRPVGGGRDQRVPGPHGPGGGRPRAARVRGVRHQRGPRLATVDLGQDHTAREPTEGPWRTRATARPNPRPVASAST
jgi:hypothetical protein